MVFAFRRRPDGHNFQTFFYPTFFSFTIYSYIDETDFTLGLSQKYHFEKKCKEEGEVPAKEAKPVTCETK